MVDYRVYKPDKGWVIREILKIAGICTFIGILFFKNVFFVLFLLPLGCFVWKRDKLYERDRRKDILAGEFKDMIVALSGNLSAGYSLEKAFYITGSDLKKTGTEYRFILGELREILGGIELNKRVEDLLLDFAERSDIDDIKDFARLVLTAKIYGGNIVMVIKQTAGNMTDKATVENEIKTIMASKYLEGRIMVAMPFVIVLYMNITNTEYMNILYQTAPGRIIMLTSLLIILFAWILINKIMRIEV
ncbi:MAG: type II secretion system F family protein [Lachnospiraceae bacterium]|nr:type II secretion system F family protein [Lachnospiraceae bacterium]